jgi:hypothetical protein
MPPHHARRQEVLIEITLAGCFALYSLLGYTIMIVLASWDILRENIIGLTEDFPSLADIFPCFVCSECLMVHAILEAKHII